MWVGVGVGGAVCCVGRGGSGKMKQVLLGRSVVYAHERNEEVWMGGVL